MKRKEFIVLLLLCLVAVGTTEVYAQVKRRPLPDWVFEKPHRSNTTFYYHVERGTGETETEARNSAYTQAFMQVALKLGIPLNTEDISAAIASGTNIRMLSQRFTIPMNVVCYISRPNDEIGGWNYWLLCQIPEVGYTDNARFDDFNECFKFEKYESRKREKEAEANRQRQDSLRIIRNINVRAIVASAFVPGVGQMTKKHYVEGACTLAGEIALIGTGVAMISLSNGQRKILDDASGSVDYNTYMNAKSKYDTYRYAAYGVFGAAAVLYGVNLWRAWACKNQFKEIALYPTVIPDHSIAGLAVGIGFNANF